jgi:hypothetical protein
MDRTIDLLLRNLRSEIARLEKKNEEAMATIKRLSFIIQRDDAAKKGVNLEQPKQ